MTLLCTHQSHDPSATPLLPKNRGNLGRTTTDFETLRLQYTLRRLSTKSIMNFVLSLSCLMYVAVNVVCFIMNCCSKEFRHRHSLVFHLLEFWATFFFSIISLLVFTFTPKAISSFYRRPFYLKLILFMNVVFTLVPAVLLTVDKPTFEVMSHELEYVVGMLQALMDIAMLYAIAKSVSIRTLGPVFFLFLAIVQIIIYNFCANGEQIAHFIEFIFEILTASITFSFCVDNKFYADNKICESFHYDCGHPLEECDLVL